jgi:hypothetical protein
LGKPQISHVDPNITFQKTTQQLTELTDAQLTLIVTCLPFGPKTRFFLEVISSMAPVPGEQKSRQKRVVSWGIYGFLYAYPLVMTNIAMENGPFIDGLPIKNCDFPWPMLNNQMVCFFRSCGHLGDAGWWFEKKNLEFVGQKHGFPTKYEFVECAHHCIS